MTKMNELAKSAMPDGYRQCNPIDADEARLHNCLIWAEISDESTGHRCGWLEVGQVSARRLDSGIKYGAFFCTRTTP